MKNFLENSRYIILIGIAGTFLAALSLFLFGLGGVLVAVWDALTVSAPFDYGNLKEISIVLIQAIDIFLLATFIEIIDSELQNWRKYVKKSQNG